MGQPIEGSNPSLSAITHVTCDASGERDLDAPAPRSFERQHSSSTRVPAPPRAEPPPARAARSPRLANRRAVGPGRTHHTSDGEVLPSSSRLRHRATNKRRRPVPRAAAEAKRLRLLVRAGEVDAGDVVLGHGVRVIGGVGILRAGVDQLGLGEAGRREAVRHHLGAGTAARRQTAALPVCRLRTSPPVDLHLPKPGKVVEPRVTSDCYMRRHPARVHGGVITARRRRRFRVQLRRSARCGSSGAAVAPAFNRPAVIIRRAVLGGELAVPCTCNPLQQG